MRLAVLAAAAFAASVATGAMPAPAEPSAPPLPRAAPEQVGFTPEGLARIDRFFYREIAAQHLPGAVVAIAREGKLVYYKAFGRLRPDAPDVMPLDAVFSIASMTKPMAAVGGLVLMEEGRLPMHSKLSDYFPEFSEMKVGTEEPSGTMALRPAASPVYIQDLYRHTAGMVYGARGHSPMHKLYPPSSAGAATTLTGAQFVEKLAAAPLLHDPGTYWDYSLSVDLLGLVIEHVAGERLDTYLRHVLWGPAGMHDTGFEVPQNKRARIALPLPNDPLTGKPQHLALVDAPAKFDCAGGCGFGTVGDYLRFGQMLLNGGTIDGHRILSPRTVAYMTSDQLPTDVPSRVGGTETQREGYGFGLTVAVRTHPGIAAVPGSVGDYMWNGANGTIWWNDPAQKLVVVVGAAAPGELRQYLREEMADLVYGAMSR